MRTENFVDVVCALIVRRGEVLIVQHGHGSKHPGKWEFPGGKIHAGEMPATALTREILEELGVEVEILTPLSPVNYTYPGKQVRLIPFVCRLADEVIVLHEHQDFRWLTEEELFHYDLLPADREMLETGDNFLELRKILLANNQQFVDGPRQ